VDVEMDAVLARLGLRDPVEQQAPAQSGAAERVERVFGMPDAAAFRQNRRPRNSTHRFSSIAPADSNCLISALLSWI
jgi:hypothetical protein